AAATSIGIGATVARRPLPHHRAYGSVHGGSKRFPNVARTTKGDHDHGKRQTKAQNKWLSNGPYAMGHGRWQQYPPPIGRVPLTQPSRHAGGVWFSTAAIAQPEGVREPNPSTGSTGPAFRRIRNSRANPACTELVLPSSSPSSRSWPAA